MITTLSKLVEMTQGTAIPAWLRDAVLEKKDEIVKALRENGEYTLEGQNGEKVIIRAEKQVAAA
jgi:hypothetical protein